MNAETKSVAATAQYAAAYDAHYTARDLSRALTLYSGLVADHPSSLESGYAAVQIQNIAHRVVPDRERLDANLSMALAHLATDGGQ